MKIGIDARSSIWYRGTGIGTYTYQLVKNINLIDKLNSYLLFFPKDNVLDLTPGENINIATIPDSTEISDSFWKDVELPNLLKDGAADIYLIPQNGIGAPKVKNCPISITLHDVIPYRLPETVGPQYLEVYNRDIPRIIPMCDSIITVSEFSRRDISQALNFPLDKIYVTPLAAEDMYYPRNRTMCRDYVKASYGISSPFILYVGGFSPRKNIMGLIEAYSRVKDKLPKDMKLVIAGKKGRSYYDYRDLAHKLSVKNDVIFPGYIPVDELPIFYNACEVFCYPSFYEGFGLPPLEAMACGTPCISSNLTSMPEILGDDCVYIDPHDPCDIGEKLLKVLLDEEFKTALSFKGLKRAFSYSWKKTASETIQALMNTAKG